MSIRYKDQIVSGGSSSSSEEVYSTEETRIGTWIDGKPLYRKCWSGITSSKTSSWISIIDCSDLNVDEVIDLSIVYRQSDGFTTLSNYLSPSGYTVLMSYSSSKKTIDVYNANNTLTLIVKFEYTKTTDEAVDSNA